MEGTVDGTSFRTGDRVRVRPDCPLTLPAYARIMEGVVIGPAEEGFLAVRFGEDRTFPVAPEYLDRVADEPA